MKCPNAKAGALVLPSPSVWRVWIEIICLRFTISPMPVTLRVEGVD